ncbi:MAG: hypothetical protein E2O89_06390 [Alphaproteobacteria bacterium]|nr:MAG: hypothetical protein E2O89_06390 [Alphaproteobacteria bacterium]
MMHISEELAGELAQQVPISQRYQVFLKTVLTDRLWNQLAILHKDDTDQDPSVNFTYKEVEILLSRKDLDELIENESRLEKIFKQVRSSSQKRPVQDTPCQVRVSETEKLETRQSIGHAFIKFLELIVKWREKHHELHRIIRIHIQDDDHLPSTPVKRQRKLFEFVNSVDNIPLRDERDAAIAIMALDRIYYNDFDKSNSSWENYLRRTENDPRLTPLA